MAAAGVKATLVSLVMVVVACLALVLATTSSPIDDVASCDGGFTLVGGKCVLLEPFTQTTWHESRYLCQTLGGDLVVLDSMDFFADLITHMKDTGLDIYDYWVGGSLSGGSWGWVDSTRVRMRTPLWAEQLSYGLEPTGPGACTFLDVSRFLYMNNDNCTSSKRCICQAPSTKHASSTSPSDRAAVHAVAGDGVPLSDSFILPDDPAKISPTVNSVAATFTSTTPVQQTCGGVFESVGGKCVLVDPFTYVSWEEARYFCQTIGGDLVVLDSMDFYAALIDYIEDIGLTSHNYWVGANDKASEGTWVWVDGTSVRNGTPLWQFRCWGEDDCTQDPFNENPDTNCGAIQNYTSFYLSDVECYYEEPFICQAPAVFQLETME